MRGENLERVGRIVRVGTGGVFCQIGLAVMIGVGAVCGGGTVGGDSEVGEAPGFEGAEGLAVGEGDCCELSAGDGH